VFGFGAKKRQRRINRRPKNVRARDGYPRLTSSERRGIRTRGGLKARPYTKLVKGNRRYKRTGSDSPVRRRNRKK